MEKQISQMSKEELADLIKEVQHDLAAQGIKFKKPKYVRKKSPWNR